MFLAIRLLYSEADCHDKSCQMASAAQLSVYFITHDIHLRHLSSFNYLQRRPVRYLCCQCWRDILLKPLLLIN